MNSGTSDQGQGGMMLDLGDLPRLRERVLEIVGPSCRVRPGAIAGDAGPVEHVLDALPDAGRRFRFLGLYRAQHGQHVRLLNV